MTKDARNLCGTLKVKTHAVSGRLRNPSVQMEVFQQVPVLELTTRKGVKLQTELHLYASRGEAQRAKPDVYEAMADVLREQGFAVLKLECLKCGHSMDVECSSCDPMGEDYWYDE